MKIFVRIAKAVSVLVLSASFFVVEVVSDSTSPGYSHETDVGFSSPNWMHSIPDSSRLSQLSIPGTHDTMSSMAHNPNGFLYYGFKN